MYRIRSVSGTEAVYNSLEEFTAAVRRGAVTPDDEIFHSRANRWLDVKSHPHYRSAINWSGPLSADAIFAAPPAPPAPKPAAPAAAGPRHGGGLQPPRQVAEIPAAPRPAGATVLRPQLSATPPSPPPAAPPKAKSGDLPFIDLDEPKPAAAPAPARGPAIARTNATIIEAKKPPVQAPAKSDAAASEFLVMDSGLESPARTSNGHRAIVGDADMLFDVPASAPLPTPQAATTVAPAAPEPVSTTPAPTPAPAPSPASVREPAPAIAAAPPPAAPAVPGASAAAPSASATAAPGHKAIESRPANAAAPEPPSVAAANPVRNSGPAVKPASSDLDIPGAPLLDSPGLRVAPVSAPVPANGNRRSIGMLAGAGALVLIVAGGAILWHPWSRTGSAQRPSPKTAPAATEVQGLPPFRGTAETTLTAAAAAARPGVPPVAAQQPAPAKPAADSGSEARSEEVIAARPSLRAPTEAPTPELDLSADLSTGTTAASVATPADLARRLESAEKQAQQDLAARLGNFRSVLSLQRLGTPDGIAAAQNAWSGGADAIRQYRARIARLEQSYEDSVLASQRSQRWSADQMRAWASHQSPAEPGETSQLVDLMLNQVGEGLGLLATLGGDYEIRDGKIRFRNPASASRYLGIRTWVQQRTESWNSVPEGARPQTVSLILRALGEGFPPVE